jgi:Fe2+ or Zn2+ uptake regulation protein
MKYSRQRELILETLRSSSKHPTAEELYGDLKKVMPNLSLGTIYRNLNLLADLKQISRLEGAGSNSIRYDARNDEHCHLICTVCNKIQDVDLEYFSPVDTTLQDKLGFKVKEHGIVLKGICSDCVQENNTR